MSERPRRSAYKRALAKIVGRSELQETQAALRSFDEVSLAVLVRTLLEQHDAAALVQLCDAMSRNFAGLCRVELQPYFAAYLRTYWPQLALGNRNAYEVFKLLNDPVASLVEFAFPETISNQGNEVLLKITEKDDISGDEIPLLAEHMLNTLNNLDLEQFSSSYSDLPNYYKRRTSEDKFYAALERAAELLNAVDKRALAFRDLEYGLPEINGIFINRDNQGRVESYKIDYSAAVSLDDETSAFLDVEDPTALEFGELFLPGPDFDTPADFSLDYRNGFLFIGNTITLSPQELIEVLRQFVPVSLLLDQFSVNGQHLLERLAAEFPTVIKLD